MRHLHAADGAQWSINETQGTRKIRLDLPLVGSEAEARQSIAIAATGPFG
jgi:hypothetical protein